MYVLYVGRNKFSEKFPIKYNFPQNAQKAGWINILEI